MNVRSLFATITEHPRTVLLIPFLCVGGAKKYAADLVDTLTSLSQGPVLVIVTDYGAKEAQDWKSLNILAPFQQARVVFWPEICGPGYTNPTVMGRLLNLMRPAQVVVINSRLGLDVIASFGRGLSQLTKLYCAYFSLGVQGLGAPYGTRFPSRTLPFSIALTDNTIMLSNLNRLWGELPGPGIAELPPRIQLAEDLVFFARLEARRLRVNVLSRPLRWLWVSRVEVLKGTVILAEISRIRPTDHFDVLAQSTAH